MGSAKLSAPRPPQATRRPAIHEQFGVPVTDDYEWLEDDKNPETITFANTENSYARSVLDGMSGRAGLRTRIATIIDRSVDKSSEPESKEVYPRDALDELRKKLPQETKDETLSVAVFGDNDTVYAISHKGAPRGKVVSYGLSSGRHFDMVPESDGVLTDLVATRSALYLIEVAFGSSRIRRLPLGIKPEPLAREVPKPEPSKPSKKARNRSSPRTSRKNPVPKPVRPLATTIPLFDRGVTLAELPIVPLARVLAAEKKDNDLLLRIETYLEPPAWYRYIASEHRLERFRFDAISSLAAPVRSSKPKQAVPVRSSPTASTSRQLESALILTAYDSQPRAVSDTEVVREKCTSNGSTKVFMNIVRRKGAVLSGASPTLLIENSDGILPSFRPWHRAWLDAGGILAEPDLRGAGKTHEKVANDFFECAKALSSRGFTKPDKLGIMSQSANSFLMGAAMVQHPEMFRAVVSENGNYDSLGTRVKNETEFRTQVAFSPYYNTKNGTTYPAVLLMTSDGESRQIENGQARKMVARLRATNSGSRPILLRASERQEVAASDRLEREIDATVDMLAFLFNELGMQLPTATH